MITRLATAFVLALGLLVTAPAPVKAEMNIQEVTSPGGITAWLVEDDSLPLVAFQFTFKAGSTNDPDGKEGLAHLLSTMLDEGAGDMESEAFQRAVESDGIRLGFDAGDDYFGGNLQTHSDYLDEAIGLLALALTSPRFDEEPLARMKRSLIASLRRAVTQPSWGAWRAADKIMFEGHQYARFTNGTEASLSALTADDLRAFKQANLVKDGLEIAVVGDISAERLATALDQIFGALPETSTSAAVPDLPLKGMGQKVLIDMDLPQAEIIVIQPGINRDDPDWWSARVMNHVLGGGGFGSRLTEEIREKRGLTYGIFSWLQVKDHTNMFVASTAVKNDKVGETIDLIKAEWAKMKADGVTEDEMVAAKTYLSGALALRMTSTQKIANVLRGIKDEGLGIDYLNRRNAIIDTVTQESIARVAKDLLVEPDELLIIVAGKPEGFVPDVTYTFEQLSPLGLPDAADAMAPAPAAQP